MRSKIRKNLKNYLELSKLKIVVPVSLTGFTGYFIFNQHITIKTAAITAGIFLLALSASVFNQVQEKSTDAKMNRTRNRPVPSGKISVRNAILFSVITLLTGAILIYNAGNFQALMIGLITILWYNGIYTNAKKITAYAVVPGAITGALPPLIGWVAAGGSPVDRTIILIEFLFFIGQVPHFWLIILKYGKEYEQAGMPSLTRIMSNLRIGRLIFYWVVASAIATTLLYIFEIVQSRLITGILLFASMLLMWRFSGLMNPGEEKNNFNKYKVALNSYFLLVMILLISDKIISGPGV